MRNLFFKLRKLIVILLIIGLPIFIYLAFFATEPLFDVEDDLIIGRSTVESIMSDPEEYPILDREENLEAYMYLEGLVDKIVSGPDIKYKEIFAYDSVKIIMQDTVLNAFCAPGGYIYVYSGIIKYLDHEDHLAGILGHEIAHAELRHSSKKLQKEYGKDRLMDLFIIASPDLSLLKVIGAEMVNSLTKMDYSREMEAEADMWSVNYMIGTGYACNATAGFFKKALDAGDDVSIPEILSDHPDSQRRVNDINARAKELACSTVLSETSSWKHFQSLIP